MITVNIIEKLVNVSTNFALKGPLGESPWLAGGELLQTPEHDIGQNEMQGLLTTISLFGVLL
jgi:hypothetical protein